MNPWLFSFLVSFVLLVLLADWKQMNKNVYAGILSAAFMQAETLLAAKLGLFEYNLVSENLPDMFLVSNSVNIFLTGIAFNMGILIAGFHPGKMGCQLLASLGWALFLIAFNYMLDIFGLVNYLRFKPYFVVRQFLLFLFLAWIKNNFVFKDKTSII